MITDTHGESAVVGLAGIAFLPVAVRIVAVEIDVSKPKLLH